MALLCCFGVGADVDIHYKSVCFPSGGFGGRILTLVSDGEIMQIEGLFVKEKILYSKNIIP
jgi:hypothetical protein